MDPAAIRFNNPGAMWGKGNKIALKWGASSTTMLNDGLGQGNNIAYFPTKMAGACAQFDLWRSGYCNRSLRDAILKWSGGNWSAPYANEMSGMSGIGLDEIITPMILASSRGWKLMKTQAKWEAGRTYPLSDGEWIQAQQKVFGGSQPLTPAQKKTAAATAVVVTTGSVAGQAVKSGSHWGVVFGILFVGVIMAVGVWVWMHRSHESGTAPPAPRPLPLDPNVVAAAVAKDQSKPGA